MEFKEEFVGSQVEQFPTNTHNNLILEALRARAQISPAADPPAALKSPVHVLLRWNGSEPIGPGHTVKLGAVLQTPTDNESAPFNGLMFHASAFVGGDSDLPFAFTLGPISALGVGAGLIVNAWWAKVYVSDLAHEHAVQPAGGTVLQSGTTGFRILYKQAALGEVWAVVEMVQSTNATADPPLRRFELTVDKATLDLTATGKFLDDDENMLGSPVTLYDPEVLFRGRVAGYVSGDAGAYGFHGVALLRRDLAEVEEDRWEIVEMEAFSEFVVLEYAGSPDNEWQLKESSVVGWGRRQPAEENGPITVDDPLDIVPTPVDGDKIIATLIDPDTNPPTYQLIEKKVTSGIGTSNLQWGEVQAGGISDMTAWGTWGTGNVQFKDDAGSNDGAPAEVENRYPTEFEEGSSVCCDRAFDPPRVVSGSCETVS